MEKVLQEFRIIETDDGFRIEIKGDKEQLREWVMSLDPRRWMGRGPEWGFPFGPPPPFMRGRWRKHGPFGAWFGFGGAEEDDDDEPHGKRKHHHGHHHHGGEDDEPDTV